MTAGLRYDLIVYMNTEQRYTIHSTANPHDSRVDAGKTYTLAQAQKRIAAIEKRARVIWTYWLERA